MNKERVYFGSDRLGPEGAYQQTEIALYFAPQASADAPLASNTQRTLCTADGEPFVLPSGATLAKIVAVPAPYGARGAHVASASAATLAALSTAYIRLTRHAVQSTAPLAFGAAENIRVFSPEDAQAATGANTTGWITDTCDLRLGPTRLATGQALAAFGGGTDGKDAARNPAGTPDAGFNNAMPLFAHKSSAADSARFIKQPTILRGLYAGGVPLEFDVSVVLTYRLELKTYTVLEYEPFPPQLS